MTSATQLKEAAQGAPGFLGVFSSDNLPDRFEPGESLIANYDAKDRPGSHWIAMKRAPDGSGLYFDSFGLPPDAEDSILRDNTTFGQWLRSHSNGEIHWNRFDFQSLADNTCGQWATTFVKIGVLPPPSTSPADRLAHKRITRQIHAGRHPDPTHQWAPYMGGSAKKRDVFVAHMFDAYSRTGPLHAYANSFRKTNRH